MLYPPVGMALDSPHVCRCTGEMICRSSFVGPCRLAVSKRAGFVYFGQAKEDFLATQGDRIGVFRPLQPEIEADLPPCLT